MVISFSNFWNYIKILPLYSFAQLVNIFRITRKKAWLISERGDEARDNGYFLFRHIIANHPEIEPYYVISPDSNDYYRLLDESKNLVRKGCFKHYLTLVRSKYLISTHVYGATPDPSRFKKLNKYFNLLGDKKVIFLQHGITDNYIPLLCFPNLSVDLFISGAKREYDFLNKYYNQPKGVVHLTGFPRYDRLYNVQPPKRQILFMPTWRKYLTANNFTESLYFKSISAVLEDRDLLNLLEDYDFQLVFYPHFEIQKYLDSFKVIDYSDRVTIAGFTYDVQTLLKESAILITDYSSVYFDFAYMKKPILIYAFDEQEFYSKHYARGEYDGGYFGDKSYNSRQLYNALKALLTNGCVMPQKYIDNVDSFFGFHDNRCCERVIERINAL